MDLLLGLGNKVLIGQDLGLLIEARLFIERAWV